MFRNKKMKFTDLENKLLSMKIVGTKTRNSK